MTYDFFLDCLFIKIAESYYNINDFNFYTNIESDNSFCHHLIPYKNYINRFNVVTKEDISIYKANNIYQDLNKTKIKKSLNFKQSAQLSALRPKMCIFIRKCTFFSRFKKKKYSKIKKCDILYIDKGLLFHVKKCRNCTFF